MGSKKKAPPPPDYTALAKQQEEASKRAIEQQTAANRPDQVTPYGSVKWQQDPTTGKWTQTESWDPRLTGLMDQSIDLQGKSLDQIQSLMNQGTFQSPEQLDKFNPYEMTAGEFNPSVTNLPQYDQAAGDEYGRMFADSLLARVKPQQEIDQGRMENKLRMQGLVPGTEAYDRAYKNLLTSQGDVNAQAQLQGLLAGAQEARDVYGTQLQGALAQAGLERDNYGTKLDKDQLAAAINSQNQQGTLSTQQQRYDQAMKQYLLPWQTAAATQGLATGQQGPDFQGFSSAGQYTPADVLGAAQQTYAQKMQAYNESRASRSGKGGALGSIAGGVLGGVFGGPMGARAGSTIGGAAGGALFSDPVLKDDLRPISDEEAYVLMSKIIPHKWRWSGTSVEDMGVDAEQLLAEAPHLVDRGTRGLLQVNYTALFAILLGAFRHLAKKEAENANAAV